MTFLSVLKWIDAGVDRDARTLARRFANAFPSALEGSTSRKSNEIRTRAMEELLASVTAFQKERRIGLLKRIIFARSFQDELKEERYSGSLIRQITGDVLSRITFADKH
jgi:hypothetical protein